VRRNGFAIAARLADQHKRELPIQRMGNFRLRCSRIPERRTHRTLSHPLRMFIGMEVRPFVDEEIEPIGALRVETENSIWFVTPERYQRLPREERPRPEVRSIEHRLADGEWHRLRRCWWRVHDDGDRQLRILPEVGPVGGRGIVTGIVVATSGSWQPAKADADDFSLEARA
jgi:hypothetical protein